MNCTRQVTVTAGPAIGLCLALLGSIAPTTAHAHHVPGHGMSESVRSINSLGPSGRSQTRMMLLTEFLHETTSFNPGQRYMASILVEYAPVANLSFGVQAPLLVNNEVGLAPTVGYGDTRVQVNYTPHGSKLIHRVLTFSLAASFPTRTVRSTTDPGNLWGISPSAIFTRTYSRFYWQVLSSLPIESRPAGVALESSSAAQAGYKFARNKLSVGAGAMTDIRLANWCTAPGGQTSFCRGNRASENEREVGTTRAALLAASNFRFNDWGSLNAAVYVPLTAKRSFDIAASLGIQASF